MEMGGELHDPAALPPVKSPMCPLDRRLGGHNSHKLVANLESTFLKVKLSLCFFN